MIHLAAYALGVALALATFLGLVAGAWALWRGGGGTALTTLETANRVLEQRIATLEGEKRTLVIQVSELTKKTDAAMLAPILDWTAGHETRAQERHVATLNVLELIATRLGPDPDPVHD